MLGSVASINFAIALLGRSLGQVLQSLVACYATASTLGGMLYDLGGWRACAAYHAALQLLQAFLLFTEPAVWASWSEWRHGTAVADLNDTPDSRQTASIVPVMEDSPPESSGPGGKPPSLLLDDLLPSPLATKPASEITGAQKVAQQPRVSTGSQASRKSGKNARPNLGVKPRVSFAAARASFFSQGGFGLGAEPSHRQSTASAAAGGARRSLMSRFPDLPRSSVAVKMSRRSMACGNMIPMTMPREASQLMFFDEEEEEMEDGEPRAVGGAGQKGKKKIPSDIMLPALLICLIGFNHNLSYQSEWTLYAVFFAEQHGWTSATWAGLAQTSGDVLGAMIMQFQARCAGSSEEDGFDGHAWRRLLHALTAKPYTASWILLFWAILNLALTAPSLPVAVTAQVVMGTVFVLSMQATTKMNLFFSLGDGGVFLALQVLRQNSESCGSALAALVSLLLYEHVHPLAPFWLTAGVSILIFVLYTLGFCKRVGFGKSLDTAEEERSQRKGLKREKTWQKSTATMATTTQRSTALEE